MQNLLKAASLSDEKRTAMMEELKIAVKEEREKLSKQRHELNYDRTQLEEFKKMKENENLALIKQVDEFQYELNQKTVKYESLQQRFMTVE